jgi:hypothetical protein
MPALGLDRDFLSTDIFRSLPLSRGPPDDFSMQTINSHNTMQWCSAENDRLIGVSIRNEKTGK